MKKIIAVISSLCFVLLIVFSDIVKQGVINGLNICTSIIIPSLFIFMAFTSFITKSGIHKIISAPFAFITKNVFHLDKSLGSIILMSFLGGYPIGANAINELYSLGEMDRKTAENMLCFCFCGAPSFIISGIGGSIFHSDSIGLAIYISDIASAMLLGAFILNKNKSTIHPPHIKYQNLTESFVNAVNSSVQNLAVMCGYIILFSGILELVENLLFKKFGISGIFPTLLSGILEVTCGCLKCSKLNGKIAYYMAVLFISFGGLSVIFQVLSMIKDLPVNRAKIVMFRVFHAILAVLISPISFRIFCSESALASARAYPPRPEFLPNSPVIFILIAFMLCSVIFRPRPSK